MKLGSLLAFVIFVLVAFAHLVRLVYSADVTVNETMIPMWVSVAGVIVPSLIAILLWREGDH